MKICMPEALETELQVRGPWVAKEYFKLGRSPEHFTKDGWFRTGDVSTIDEDGFMQRGGGVSEAP